MALFGLGTSDNDAPIVGFGSRAGGRDEDRHPLGGPLKRELFEATELTAYGTRIGKLIFVIIFATIWNGVTSIFATLAIQSILKGNPEWFLILFIIPFVLIGLGAIAFLIHSALALTNPQAILSLPTQVVQLGDDLEIAWRFSKRPTKLTSLVIEVLAKEKATYRRGTDTVTDTEVIRRIEVFRADQPGQIAATSATVTIPADAMHSFEASRNEINWHIHVKGEIPRWPDIDDEYQFYVTPGRPRDFMHQ